MGLHQPYLAVEKFIVKYIVQPPGKLTSAVLLVCIQTRTSVCTLDISMHSLH